MIVSIITIERLNAKKATTSFDWWINLKMTRSKSYRDGNKLLPCCCTASHSAGNLYSSHEFLLYRGISRYKLLFL